jgi:hypothetical protein
MNPSLKNMVLANSEIHKNIFDLYERYGYDRKIIIAFAL